MPPEDYEDQDVLKEGVPPSTPEEREVEAIVNPAPERPSRSSRGPDPLTGFVIRDVSPGQSGWAVNNPVEGWIFTIRLESATVFSSAAEARAAAHRHYTRCSVEVRPLRGESQ